MKTGNFLHHSSPAALETAAWGSLLDLPFEARGSGLAASWPTLAVFAGVPAAFLLLPFAPAMAAALLGSAVLALAEYRLRLRRIARWPEELRPLARLRHPWIFWMATALSVASYPAFVAAFFASPWWAFAGAGLAGLAACFALGALERAREGR